MEVPKMIYFLLLSFALSAEASANPFNFKTKSTHITFTDNGIPPTQYRLKSDGLSAEVDKSASALVYGFSKIRTVSEVSFSWKTEGTLNLKDSRQEKTKAGDDFKLRVGLMLSGEAPFIPFFAPGWVKAIRNSLTLPTDQLVYLAVGTKNKPGVWWESPYSDSMKNVAVPSRKLKAGWWRASYKTKPLQVVGLWVMSDGDNTKSSFKSHIRNLYIK
jgi:hypothetical protein